MGEWSGGIYNFYFVICMSKGIDGNVGSRCCQLLWYFRIELNVVSDRIQFSFYSAEVQLSNCCELTTQSGTCTVY